MGHTSIRLVPYRPTVYYPLCILVAVLMLIAKSEMKKCGDKFNKFFWKETDPVRIHLSCILPLEDRMPCIFVRVK